MAALLFTDTMRNKEINWEREMNSEEEINPEREVKVNKFAKFWTHDLMVVSRPNLRLKKEDELITS